jgi:ribosome biogenesis GTPase
MHNIMNNPFYGVIGMIIATLALNIKAFMFDARLSLKTNFQLVSFSEPMTETEQGIVVAAHGRFFEVRAENGDRIKCEARGKLKAESEATTPAAVGDDVRFTRSGDELGVIEEILERRTAFFRPDVGVQDKMQVIAANLDRLAIVASIQSPALKTGMIDRFIIAARIGELKPIIIINKTDLESPDGLDEFVAAYCAVGFEVCLTSCESGDGLENLKKVLAGHRSIFVGHSGVGKSTLMNCLLPGLNIKTKPVSEYSNRGQHTTTHIEIFELPSGGFFVDSPGLKVMGLWEVDREELPYYYPDFEPYLGQCRFSTCTHNHEPDCAVKEAVEQGAIAAFRYKNYLAIADSL